LKWDYFVSVENLNLRSDGFANSTIVKVLKRGDKLKYLGVSSNGHYIRVQTESGIQGYVRNVFVKQIKH